MTLAAVMISTAGGSPAWSKGQHVISKNATILNFPTDHSMGTLIIRGNDGKLKTLPARGAITVPSGSFVQLTASYDSVFNLSPLRQLPPDGIHRYILGKLELNDSQLTNIAFLTGLESLDVEETDVSDKGLQALRGMNRLREIDLHSTMITGRGFKFLAQLPNLETINAGSNRIGDDGIEYLIALKKLKELHLSRGGLTNQALVSLSRMPQLTILDIQYNNRITDAGIAQLSRLKNLEILQIGETSIGGVSVKTLRKLPSLKNLVYSPRQFSRLEIVELHRALPKCRIETTTQHKGIPSDLFQLTQD